MKVPQTFFIIFLLFTSYIFCVAQKTSPTPQQPSPPPPVRKGVTTIVGSTSKPQSETPPKPINDYDDKSWSEYTDEAGGYSVSVIGKPKVQKQTLETEVGPIEMSMNVWITGAAQYAIAFSDYPVVPVETESLNAQYEKIQGKWLSGSSKLVSQKEFTYEAYQGREAVFESNENHLRVRFIYIGNRLYQMIFATRPMATQSKYIVEFTEKTANKFFSSFKISNQILQKANEIVAEEKAPSLIDAIGISGEFNLNIYTNKILGVELQLPIGWHRLTDDETEMSRAKAKEVLHKETEKAKKNDELARKNVRILFTVVNRGDDTDKKTNFIMVVERLPYKRFPIELYANQNIKSIKETFNTNLKSVSTSKNIKIGGKDFQYIDLTLDIEGKQTFQRVMLTIHKGVGMGFSFVYTSEDDLKILNDILSNVTFN